MRAETERLVDEIEKSLALLAPAARLGDRRAPARRAERDVRGPGALERPGPRAEADARPPDARRRARRLHAALAQELADQRELIELGEAEGDDAVVADAEAAIRALRDQAAAKETEALLDGEADGNDTFLEVNAGAGGTESCDWAAMLARMYVRWAEAHGMKVELIAESPGEEAGIRSVTYRINGPNAYGWLKTESGRAPPGAHLALRQRRAAAHLVLLGLGLSGRRRQHRDRDRSRTTSASTPTARRAPAASTSTPPTRRCASPTCRPTSW